MLTMFEALGLSPDAFIKRFKEGSSEEQSELVYMLVNSLQKKSESVREPRSRIAGRMFLRLAAQELSGHAERIENGKVSK